MPDHIHTVVGIPPTMSISQARHLLKGASSQGALQKEAGVQAALPSGAFLEPGYILGLLVDADAETVIQYVRDSRPPVGLFGCISF